MPKPKRMGAIIGGALALLVAAGVAAWFLMKKDETPQPPAKPAAPAAAPACGRCLLEGESGFRRGNGLCAGLRA